MRYCCCCCGQPHLFVRIIYHEKCILLQLQGCWRRQRGELQDTEEGLDNPLFAEGTRYEVHGIELFCQWKICSFISKAWRGEWITDGPD